MIHANALTSGFENLIHIKFNKEIMELGIFKLSIQLGRDLMGLSLTYFMFSFLNYEIWQIFCFYFLRQVPFFFTIPFITHFIEKFGLKHGVSTRGAVSIIFYLLLPVLMTTDFWQSILWLMPLFIIRSFFINTSNVAYDICIAKHMNQHKQGSAMAGIQIAIMAGAVLAPIMGAFITASLGFEYVTYFGALVLLIGSLILYATPDEKFKVPYTPKKMVRDSFRRTSKYFFQAELGRIFFDVILWIIWPIFLIISLDSITDSGMVIGFSSGIAMIAAFFIGKRIDTQKKSQSTILKHGAYRSTFLNFFRAIWIEPMTLSIIDALSRINDQTIKVPYQVHYYKWMHEKDTFERAHIARFLAEGFYMSIIAFILLIFWVFRDMGTPPKEVFIGIFTIGALGMVLTTQIRKINRK